MQQLLKWFVTVGVSISVSRMSTSGNKHTLAIFQLRSFISCQYGMEWIKCNPSFLSVMLFLPVQFVSSSFLSLLSITFIIWHSTFCVVIVRYTFDTQQSLRNLFHFEHLVVSIVSNNNEKKNFNSYQIIRFAHDNSHGVNFICEMSWSQHIFIKSYHLYADFMEFCQKSIQSDKFINIFMVIESWINESQQKQNK